MFSKFLKYFLVLSLSLAMTQAISPASANGSPVLMVVSELSASVKSVTLGNTIEIVIKGSDNLLAGSVTTVNSDISKATINSSVTAVSGLATFTVNGLALGSSDITFGADGYTGTEVRILVNLPSVGEGDIESTSSLTSSWVGAQSISCPAPNPWVKEKIGFARQVSPVVNAAENLTGKTIAKGSLETLGKSGVVFDTTSTKVSTATETLPIYGCKDKLLSGKVNQPIQFIAGGYTLQSNAHGYINTPDLKWHDINGVTLYTNTATFMHTIKFTKAGKYVVVLTEQPDTSRGLIPTYGVRNIRFVININ